MQPYHVIVEPGFWDKLAAIGTVAAFVAVAVTLVFSLLGQRATREQLTAMHTQQDLAKQGLDQERQIAENTAARAESAARVSAEYSERTIAALEQLAASGLGGSYATPGRVRWSLEKTSKDGYRLTNIGGADAWDVVIMSDETLSLIGVPEAPMRVQPGEAIAFYAAVTLGTRDMTVTVQWANSEGKAADQTWRYPLPF